MQRRARHDAARLVALTVLAIAAGGSEFRGCGGEERPAVPEDGTPLPASSGGCLVDADCVSEDMCVALACRAGTCVEAGPGIDDDGDGFAPVPCGDDCDDMDAEVRPGASERCDGIDQDCDGRIDEDATGVRTYDAPAALFDTRLVGLAGEYTALGNDLDGDPANTLAAYVIGPDGAASTPGLVGTDLAPDAFDAARVGDSIVLAVTAGPDDPPARVPLTRSGDAWSAGTPEPIGTQTGAERIAIHAFGGQEWVAFDARPGGVGGLTRWLWRAGDPSGLISLGAVADEDAAPALADDGARVWATVGERTLSAFDADGIEVASQELPGRFGYRPLAPGDALVYAVYRDAFDHVMTRVTTESFTSPIAAPAGNATDRVSIFRAGDDVLVTRTSDVAVTAWLLEDDLRTYRGSSFPLGTSVSPTVIEVGVGTTDEGTTAVLGAVAADPPTAVLTVLACDVSP